MAGCGGSAAALVLVAVGTVPTIIGNGAMEDPVVVAVVPSVRGVAMPLLLLLLLLLPLPFPPRARRGLIHVLWCKHCPGEGAALLLHVHVDGGERSCRPLPPLLPRSTLEPASGALLALLLAVVPMVVLLRKALLLLLYLP